ncbi:MAG: HlyD family efflux transporter periplasmic adaptor subunit [Acidobacteria bacterium]|nr:HlyD family efflux transporter periplasmic adaptor subunit [Acidobacteriota bacterium]
MRLAGIAATSLVVLLASAAGCRSGDGDLELSGSVEVTRIRLGFGVSGTVEAVRAEEGGRVAAGDTLAVLDTVQLALEAEMRASELDALRAVQEGLEGGLRPQEVGQALAARESATAAVELARSEFARIDALYEADAVSMQNWENAHTALLLAEAALSGANQGYSLASDGYRDADIEAAAARVQAAEAAHALALERLEDAVLISPCDATVLTVAVEPGEMVAAGGTAAILGLMDTVDVVAWVQEPYLASLRLGQEALVTCDGPGAGALPARLATVSDEAEFTPSTVETREERVSLVYRLTFRVANSDGILKAGMPVDITIPLEEPGE